MLSAFFALPETNLYQLPAFGHQNLPTPVSLLQLGGTTPFFSTIPQRTRPRRTPPWGSRSSARLRTRGPETPTPSVTPDLENLGQASDTPGGWGWAGLSEATPRRPWSPSPGSGLRGGTHGGQLSATVALGLLENHL